MRKKITKKPEAWYAYINTSLRKTVTATLDTAERIGRYRDNAEPNEFQANMTKWFGMSSSQTSYWLRINDALPRFNVAVKQLPSSQRTLYELSAIDDDLWYELVDTNAIKPTLTVEQAKKLKTDGGILKKVMKEYGEADNFFDISNKLKDIMAVSNTPKAGITEFNIWLKDNPPEFSDSDDEIEAEEDGAMDGEYIPAETSTKVKKEKVVGASKELRVKCLGLFGIFVDKPIVDEDVLKFLDKLAGGDEAKIAAVETLENE